MDKDDFSWIIQWYKDQCDGDWEHCNIIEIHTIDNPGWRITISLGETYLENVKFNIIDRDGSEADWLYCSVENNFFKGYCSLFNIKEVLKIFREWAEEQSNKKNRI